MADNNHKALPATTRVYSWFSALQSDDTVLLNDLLAHGIPIDVPHPLRQTTALMEATRLGRTAIVHWLLEHGAAPAFLSGLPAGTPLHCAIRLKHWGIAMLLAEHMPSVAVLDGYGRTPLHVLCMETVEGPARAHAVALASRLLDKGCPLETLDHEGTTALHHCIINDNFDIAEQLLTRNANPNALIPDSRVSPLAIAALERNLTLAELLLRYGADAFQPTREGVTPVAILPALRRIMSEQMPSPEAIRSTSKNLRMRMH